MGIKYDPNAYETWRQNYEMRQAMAWFAGCLWYFIWGDLMGATGVTFGFVICCAIMGIITFRPAVRRYHMTLRLAGTPLPLGIDAPESKQEFGEESQVTLDKLISGKRIDILAVDRDIYGRYVSGIWYNGEDICLRMLEEGMAWPYFRFMRQLTAEQRLAYRQVFEVAKRERRGLWRASNPETPWDWRRRHRSLWDRFVLWLKRLLGLI